jgi:hypothetical protein
MIVQTVTLSTGQTSLTVPSPAILSPAFNYAIYFSGFRIRGYSQNSGQPSITINSNSYMISLTNIFISGITSATYQILFFSISVLQANNKFKITFQNFAEVSNSYIYTDSSNG